MMSITREVTVRGSVLIGATIVFLIGFLGAVDIIVYKGQIDFGDWRLGTEMAVPTAFGLMILSVCVGTIAWHWKNK